MDRLTLVGRVDDLVTKSKIDVGLHILLRRKDIGDDHVLTIGQRLPGLL